MGAYISMMDGVWADLTVLLWEPLWKLVGSRSLRLKGDVGCLCDPSTCNHLCLAAQTLLTIPWFPRQTPGWAGTPELLTLWIPTPSSISAMRETLFGGGCVIRGKRWQGYGGKVREQMQSRGRREEMRVDCEPGPCPDLSSPKQNISSRRTAVWVLSLIHTWSSLPLEITGCHTTPPAQSETSDRSPPAAFTAWHPHLKVLGALVKMALQRA